MLIYDVVAAGPPMGITYQPGFSFETEAGAPDRHTDLEKLHAPALDATSPASDSRRYLTSQRLSILTDTVQRPRHSAAASQAPNHASAVRVEVARMAHTRLVFRGPLALTSAILISLLMSASANVDDLYPPSPPSPPSPSPFPPSPSPPSPPSPSPFPPSPTPPSPPSPSPLPPSPSPPPVSTGFPFCLCNRMAANTPFEFTLTSVSSIPVTNVTGSFRVRPCNADGNSCCNMDLNKVEFLSGDRCQGSVQAVFVNGVSRSWSWQIYGPGRFVFKITNLGLSSRPGPNSADGVVLQIVLRPGSACPSFDSFFPGWAAQGLSLEPDYYRQQGNYFNCNQNQCDGGPGRAGSKRAETQPVALNEINAPHALLSIENMSELYTSVRVLLSDERDLSRYLPSLKGMTVLLRADLNVPTREDRTVADENRITAVLPTITMLLGAGSKVAIASHFGRPSPNKQTWAQMTAASSLDSVARVLSQRLGKQFVGLAPDCIGPKAQACVAGLQPGQACLLENTRFHAGDVDNDPAFARALGQLADVYVLDAFGAMHRDQASVTGVIAHVAASFPGPLVRHELKFLMHYMEEPVRPLAVVVGGAKVADKIGVLGSLIPKSDVVLVGGRMAFTFLAAQGVSVGATQVEEDKLQVREEWSAKYKLVLDASAMLALAEARGVQLLLPCDVRVSRSLEGPEGLALSDLTRTCCTPDKPCLPEGAYGIDIGPASEAQFAEALKRCKTIFWNGPMGKFELTAFTNVAGSGSSLVYNGSGHLALQPHGSGSMTVQSDEADSDSEDEEEVGSRQAAADMETTFGEKEEEEEEGSELGSEPVQLYAIPPKGRWAALVPAACRQCQAGAGSNSRCCAFVEVMRCQAEHRVELSSAAANPAKETTKLWRYLAGQPITKADILEYIKLAELALVMTPGLVEEERMFSAMAYLKDDTRNRLQECHLNVCARVFSSNKFDLDTFPDERAISKWLHNAAVPEFASGTRAIAQAIAEATAGGAITIVGGGGASLELVEGRALPGVTALAAASIKLPRVA
ncbi:hypothetical protein QJQ45_012523 [Haematococcus lacustris]|nr:hypothetical protein QJQ45_012523 [Haematococcus lacustris]